jgi:hypothetical protein
MLFCTCAMLVTVKVRLCMKEVHIQVLRVLGNVEMKGTFGN